MLQKIRSIVVAFLVALAITSPLSLGRVAIAQVVVFDPTAFPKLVEQTQHQIRDAQTQYQQLQTLVKMVESGDIQVDKLGEIYGSMTGDTELVSFLNQFDELVNYAKDYANPDQMLDALQRGDLSMLEALFGDTNTVGQRAAVDAAKQTLSSGGFTMERIAKMANSDNVREQTIAKEAGTAASRSVASSIAYESAEGSIERLGGLAGELQNSQNLKQSIDLNTAATVEMARTMAEIMRLNAATGMADGNAGAILAAEKQQQVDFFGN